MISQLPGTWKSVQSSCTQSNDTRTAQREPLSRRGSETSQTRWSSRTSQGPYKDSGSGVLFFSFSLYSSFFLISQKQKMVNFFSWLKKAHFICIWKNKPFPRPPRPFSIKFFFSLKRNIYAGKALKKFKHFFLKRLHSFSHFSQPNILH
jgi:hypothetical protein